MTLMMMSWSYIYQHDDNDGQVELYSLHPGADPNAEPDDDPDAVPDADPDDNPHGGQVELYSLHPDADPSKAAAMQALDASIVRSSSLSLSPWWWWRLFWSGKWSQSWRKTQFGN